jgi:hypothetical protein
MVLRVVLIAVVKASVVFVSAREHPEEIQVLIVIVVANAQGP